MYYTNIKTMDYFPLYIMSFHDLQRFISDGNMWKNVQSSLGNNLWKIEIVKENKSQQKTY